MAAQYDVNLEKCALLKCLCGSAFAAGQAPVRHLLLKSPSFLVIQIKVAYYIFRICKDSALFVCTQNNNETLRF